MASANPGVSALGEIPPCAHLFGVDSPDRLKYALDLGGAPCGRPGNSLAEAVVGRLDGRLADGVLFALAGSKASDALDATGKYVEPGNVVCCFCEAQGVAPLAPTTLETACEEDGSAGNFSLLCGAVRVRPGIAPTFLLAAACSTRSHTALLVCFADLGTKARACEFAEERLPY